MESTAVTVTLVGEPAIADAGPLTNKFVAASKAKTVIGPDVPIMEDVASSLAVIVWIPAVYKVTG